MGGRNRVAQCDTIANDCSTRVERRPHLSASLCLVFSTAFAAETLPLPGGSAGQGESSLPIRGGMASAPAPALVPVHSRETLRPFQLRKSCQYLRALI